MHTVRYVDKSFHSRRHDAPETKGAAVPRCPRSHSDSNSNTFGETQLLHRSLLSVTPLRLLDAVRNTLLPSTCRASPEPTSRRNCCSRTVKKRGQQWVRCYKIRRQSDAEGPRREYEDTFWSSGRDMSKNRSSTGFSGTGNCLRVRSIRGLSGVKLR